MTAFSANGFEIDDDDPQVPLIVIRAAYEKLYDNAEYWGKAALDQLMDELGIPMHILAETDQHLHG